MCRFYFNSFHFATVNFVRMLIINFVSAAPLGTETSVGSLQRTNVNILQVVAGPECSKQLFHEWGAHSIHSGFDSARLLLEK